MERAPMQIYLSALLFSPVRSIILREFSQFIPPWVKVVSPLRQVWNPELLVLEADAGNGPGMVFSPDNTVLASWSHDAPISLWDVTTGIEMQRILVHDSINCIKFSKDGKRLALGGRNGFVGIWELASNNTKEYKEVPGYFHVDEIAITPNGDIIAAALYKEGIGLWSTTDASQTRELNLEGCEPRAVQFAPNGQIVAILVNIEWKKFCIRLWNVATDELKELHVGTDPIRNVVFLDEGKTLASAIGRTVVQWDTETWRESFRFYLARQEELADIERVVFSPNDARYVAIHLKDGAVRLCLTVTGKEIGCFNINSDSDQLSLPPDGRYMASFTYSRWKRLIHLWTVTLDIASGDVGDQQLPLKSRPVSIYDLHFVPGTDRFLHVDGGEGREIWNWPAGCDLSTRVLPPEHSFSPDGRFLATWNEHRIQFWGPTMEGQQFKVFEMPMKNNISKDVVFSADAELVAMVGSFQTSIVRTSTWQSLSLFQGEVSGLVFSSVKDRVAWYSRSSKTVHVWDISKGAHLFQEIKVCSLIGDILLSPNGEFLSYVSRLDEHRCWVHLVKVATGQERCAFTTTQKFLQVKFAANSESIAAFGYCQAQHAWEYIVRSTSDGEVIGSLEIYDVDSTVESTAAISPTQTLGLYAVSGRRNQMQFWNLKGEKLPAFDCLLSTYKLRFSDDGGLIETRVGNLLVPRLPLEDKDLPLSTQQEVPHECVLANERWITWGWDNILWLPLDYETENLTIKGGRVAFSTDKHGVVFMELDLDKLFIRERWTKLRLEE
ncbi:hypothetical protein B0J15DRAFT_154448 [Fusarium solani]|uniref:WD40 repeat-like protein n=1 Tax=Fusarium solani TaxID=169388 RepID=A0A9P9G8T4_FUSSL|nr:uncharacterized protein B0J15DRAFT_154448 [Fusarium solani]KAH7234323.1 hypothetical protein B0J15DRAFT_154448 [Fusarium solani]